MQSNMAKTLSDFPVDRSFWADVIGCSERQLNDWWSGRRALPTSVAEVLSKAVGVPAEILAGRQKTPIVPEDVLPPLWLKARESSLGETEYRSIASARLLAAHCEELLTLMEPAESSPRLLINEIREAVDPQQPARKQGSAAASAFLRLSTLEKGATGIGEVIRAFLRARGALVLETPINSVRLEGFCVPVGSDSKVRPCIVVNSYRTTWFRRNYVILHELAHAVFDLEAENGVFDVAGGLRESPANISEQRADAFAMHALVPYRLLRAIQNRGIRLAKLDEHGLADLVAQTHAEQRLLIRAALEYGLITAEDADRLAGLRIARALRARTYHARGLADVPREQLIYPEILAWRDRLTSFPVKGLRLPIPFVRLVLQAFGEQKVTRKRAAELLMIRDEELSHYGVEPAQTEELWAS